MQNYSIFDKMILYTKNIPLLIYYIQPYQETISWSAFTLERRLESKKVSVILYIFRQ
ncbi:hypothetical protein CLOLEP_02136 [[Clostridium] leptum DSM 753]|uniref:Uncharacterized protein n=1 Tax=[Clostridium] leptum DSM 753 TaxID=428125 RepID=A7VU90_9FIRM|nr:hypothetical protein CLOLEP_02136 [[Clostridium] leptum DSM 753]